MTENEVIIHIKEDKSVRLELRENGTVRTKMITPETLFACIKGSIIKEPISTGLLPPNIICVKADETGMRYAVVEHLYDKADITYFKTEYKDFPLPRLLFGFRIEPGGRISAVNMGVPALGKLTPETPMYYYPFSNVAKFSLCTGSNTLPNIKTLQSLYHLPEFILSWPDNDDRYSSQYNKMRMERRDLMEHLRDKDRQYYYDSVLVPMPKTTLKDFL